MTANCYNQKMARPPNIPQRKKAPIKQSGNQVPLLQQAVALHQNGQLAQAQAIYLDILKSQPKHFDALHLLGVIALHTKNYQSAVDLIDKAIETYPSNANAYYNRGNALKELKQLDAAVASYDQAIRLKPDYADAYYNRGGILKELKQLDAAVASYDQVINLNPGYADAYYNRGNILKELKQLDAAVASYDQAIRLKPDYTDAYYNRGIALGELRQLDAAVANYDQVISLNPDYADAYWNKALVLLVNGDFEKGWEFYEWRWKRDAFSSPKRNFPQPLWLGVEALQNKTILLHSEQGLGDTLQFCRYAQLVAALGARVILEVERPLINLLRGMSCISELVEKGTTLPAFDYHCPLLSLPLAFKTNLNTVPASSGYLNSDKAKVENWQATLGAQTKLRVGIVWSGSTGHENDANRSLLLSDLIAYLPQDVEYVSLQKELRDVDKETLQANPRIKHFGSELKDFTDTAALCELMDIVISVDTSVAHLSGALGRPTWILLPYKPDWRWLLDGADSPWYSSVKLFRQDSSCNWDSALKSVKADLISKIKASYYS